MFLKIGAYILTFGGPVVGTLVGGPLGAAIGIALSGVGGRILHNAEPPTKVSDASKAL